MSDVMVAFSLNGYPLKNTGIFVLCIRIAPGYEGCLLVQNGKVVANTMPSKPSTFFEQLARQAFRPNTNQDFGFNCFKLLLETRQIGFDTLSMEACVPLVNGALDKLRDTSGSEHKMFVVNLAGAVISVSGKFGMVFVCRGLTYICLVIEGIPTVCKVVSDRMCEEHADTVRPALEICFIQAIMFINPGTSELELMAHATPEEKQGVFERMLKIMPSHGLPVSQLSDAEAEAVFARIAC
jgi:hypothetical protein